MNKIKYVIGTYKDSPNYPTIEDFYYEINNRFLNTGKQYLEVDYKFNLSEDVVFYDKIAKDLIGAENADMIIEKLLSDNKISIYKKTKHTTYYKLND